MTNTRENLIALFKAMEENAYFMVHYYESQGDLVNLARYREKVYTLTVVISCLENKKSFNEYAMIFREDITKYLIETRKVK